MAGRKWIFKPLVEPLADDVLYHVAKILHEADDKGMFDFDFPDQTQPVDAATAKRNRKRARDSLAKMTAKLGEPDGHNEVTVPFRAFFKAWSGSRWKAAGKNQ